MINKMYAALPMHAQTKKTIFSCKDDCILTKPTWRWTYPYCASNTTLVVLVIKVSIYMSYPETNTLYLEFRPHSSYSSLMIFPTRKTKLTNSLSSRKHVQDHDHCGQVESMNRNEIVKSDNHRWQDWFVTQNRALFQNHNSFIRVSLKDYNK